MSTPDDNHLSELVRSCKMANVHAQRKLFELCYSFAMGVCARYATSEQEAQDIISTGFYKVFSKIDLYDEKQPFKSWLRSVMVNTAIDHHRKYNKVLLHDAIDVQTDMLYEEQTVLDHLFYEDILACVRQLTPAYRLVFNMYAIDGMTHREIAETLNISIGTSKSNFSKARSKLQAMLLEKADTSKQVGHG